VDAKKQPNPWAAVAEGLKTDATGNVCFHGTVQLSDAFTSPAHFTGKTLITSAGVLTATLKDCIVK
jgi:hypothetical protein